MGRSYCKQVLRIADSELVSTHEQGQKNPATRGSWDDGTWKGRGWSRYSSKAYSRSQEGDVIQFQSPVWHHTSNRPPSHQSSPQINLKQIAILLMSSHTGINDTLAHVLTARISDTLSLVVVDFNTLEPNRQHCAADPDVPNQGCVDCEPVCRSPWRSKSGSVSIVVPVSTRRQVTIKRLSLPFTAMSASDALAAVKTLYDVANKVKHISWSKLPFSHKYRPRLKTTRMNSFVFREGSSISC